MVRYHCDRCSGVRGRFCIRPAFPRRVQPPPVAPRSNRRAFEADPDALPKVRARPDRPKAFRVRCRFRRSLCGTAPKARRQWDAPFPDLRINASRPPPEGGCRDRFGPKASPLPPRSPRRPLRSPFPKERRALFGMRSRNLPIEPRRDLNGGGPKAPFRVHRRNGVRGPRPRRFGGIPWMHAVDQRPRTPVRGWVPSRGGSVLAGPRVRQHPGAPEGSPDRSGCIVVYGRYQRKWLKQDCSRLIKSASREPTSGLRMLHAADAPATEAAGSPKA